MIQGQPNETKKSADPSQRDMQISYAEFKRCQVIQNPKSKLQNLKSKAQIPKSKAQTPRLDFGFGVAGLGPEAMLAGYKARNRKAPGSLPPTRGPNWAPISRGGFCWKSSSGFQPRVMEIGAPKQRKNCMRQSFVGVEFSIFVVSRALYVLKAVEQ